MNVKKLSEAAMISALVVIISVIAIGTGIGYTLYLDIIVPIIFCLVLLKCDLKYTLMSAITAIIIIITAVGNVPTGVYMIQSLILGIACGLFINKKSSIMDDLYFTSIVAAFVMILIDVYLSGFLGYSFMAEYKNSLEMFQELGLTSIQKEVIYYLSIATLPLGTMMITYIGGIILGKRFKLLDKEGKKKYFVIKNFRKYLPVVTLSKKTMYFGISYIIGANIFYYFIPEINNVYIETVLRSVLYISLFFIVKECFMSVNKFVFAITKSRQMFFLSEIGILYLMTKRFMVVSGGLIIAQCLLNRREKGKSI
ncbi:MAG: DUF2232 domain-containing protein [Clostridiaceae bacterium]|nr:DUF2232 domain-containing protein [Clostridiaceae bacterium]